MVKLGSPTAPRALKIYKTKSKTNIEDNQEVREIFVIDPIRYGSKLPVNFINRYSKMHVWEIT